MIVRVVASLLCPRLSSEPPGNAPISSIGREMPHIWYYCQKLRWNLCCYYNALALSTTSRKWHVFTEPISLLCLFGFSTWKTSLLCKEEDETLENITFMQRRRWNPGKHYFYAKKKMKPWKTLLFAMKKMKPWKTLLLYKEEGQTLDLSLGFASGNESLLCSGNYSSLMIRSLSLRQAFFFVGRNKKSEMKKMWNKE